MKRVEELRIGDQIFRISPDFKEFEVRDFNTSVPGRSDLIRYRIVSDDESDSLYISKESAGKGPLVRIKTLSSTHVYSTDPSFRIFYEKNRKSRYRRFLLGN